MSRENTIYWFLNVHLLQIGIDWHIEMLATSIKVLAFCLVVVVDW